MLPCILLYFCKTSYDISEASHESVGKPVVSPAGNLWYYCSIQGFGHRVVIMCTFVIICVTLQFIVLCLSTLSSYY